MPEAAPSARPWPMPLMGGLLAIYVLADAALWVLGFWYLFRGIPFLPQAGQFLTGALALMLVGGWAWRWGVAAGKIGGRPTARFGGA